MRFKSWLHRRIGQTRFRATGLSATALLLIGCLVPCASSQQSGSPLPTCESSTATNMSFVGTPPLVVKPTETGRTVKATGQVYVRNDGTVALSNWQATAYLLNYNNERQNATILLVCSQQSKACAPSELPPEGPTLEANEIRELAFTVEVERNQLPLTGLLTLKAMGKCTTKQATDAGPKKLKGKTRARGDSDSSTLQIARKQIAQNIVITLPDSAAQAYQIIIWNALAGALFLVGCLVVFRAHLGEAMGPSQWSFSSSTATNLTVVGSVLGTVLSSTVLPDYPHYMTKQSYIVLSLLFGVLVALAPLLYNFCCKPTKPDPTNTSLVLLEGTVWLFLLADAITIWAVFGQLSTLGSLFYEFAARRLISNASAYCTWIVAGGVAFSLIVFCFRIAQFYAEHHPVRTTLRAALVAGTTEPPRWSAL